MYMNSDTVGQAMVWTRGKNKKETSLKHPYEQHACLTATKTTKVMRTKRQIKQDNYHPMFRFPNE